MQRYKVPFVDHLGRDFGSSKNLCEYYGITYNTLYTRLKRGWSLEEALTIKLKGRRHTVDHLGNKFSDAREMCEFWGVKYNTYISRKGKGYSLKECLDKDLFYNYYRRGTPKACEDHSIHTTIVGIDVG